MFSAKACNLYYDSFRDLTSMDADNTIATFEKGADFENGDDHHQLLLGGEEMTSEKVNGIPNGSTEIEGLNKNLEDNLELNDDVTLSSSVEGVLDESSMLPKSISVTISKVGDLEPFSWLMFKSYFFIKVSFVSK